jgi:hypothetical protein
MSLKILRETKPIVDKVEETLQSAYASNEVFNAALDEAELVGIAGLGVAESRSSYDYRPSEVLFWTDRQAYMQELEDWTNRRENETHEAARSFIKDSEQSPVFMDLVDAIRLRRITPFVGAGLSCACGYPLWSAALIKLAARLKEQLDAAADVDALIRHGAYLRVAQILRETAQAQVDNFIRTEYRRRPDAIIGPVLLLPELATGCVVTTNFDTVIEDLFARLRQPLDGYMYGRQQGNGFVQRLLRGERCILKLHGDALQEQSYVFTESQYDEGYGQPLSFQNPLPRALRQIFIGNSLLFLGCSLEQDKTLELFKDIVDEAAFEIPDHFALLSAPADHAAKGQKEERLLDMKIRPLWYEAPDQDHSMLERILKLALAVAQQKVTLA